MKIAFTILLGAVLIAGGCKHLGPKTIPQDRFDYSSAVAESWKQQTLLNIVKLRYMDLPIFLDVAQIVSGYQFETSVNVAGQVSSADAIQGNSAIVGGSGKFTDRPTITYTPMTGQKFLEGLLKPIEPKRVFFMIQSGYSAEFVLALTVESINGHRNRSTVAGQFREAEPDFVRIIELMRDLQSTGAFGMQVEEDEKKNQTALVVLRRGNLDAEVAAKSAELRRLLGVAPELDRLRIVYSPVRSKDDELAVTTRSMLQMMSAFATYIDVPEEDVKAQRAVPAPQIANVPGSKPPPVAIHSSKTQPVKPYAAVRYRDNWFYISDEDWRSKRAFTAIMFFFTLTDTGTQENLPLITIPTS